jgi:hypothetical protein
MTDAQKRVGLWLGSWLVAAILALLVAGVVGFMPLIGIVRGLLSCCIAGRRSTTHRRQYITRFLSTIHRHRSTTCRVPTMPRPAITHHRDTTAMSDYDTDILTWSERQAALLRRRAAGELINDADLDWSNIAEEIEDVGKNALGPVARSFSRRCCTC